MQDMITHKIKTNPLNRLNTQQKVDIIVSKIIEIYCDLRISWHKELQSMNLKWKKVFECRHCLNRELSSIEIIDIVKKYIETFALEYDVNTVDIFLELKKTENNLNWIYRKKIYWYLESKNWIITRSAIDAIISGDYSALSAEVSKIEQRYDETLAQRSFRKEAENNLNNIKAAQRKIILDERVLWKKKESDQEITKKSPNTIRFENIADSFLEDEDIIIQNAQDLNNYYDHSSWIDNSKENLEQIFALYTQRKEYLKRYWLTIKMIKDIYDLWLEAKENNIQFTNNQHTWKYIKDNLELRWYKVEKYVNTEFIKIFYAWVWQKKSTYWL